MAFVAPACAFVRCSAEAAAEAAALSSEAAARAAAASSGSVMRSESDDVVAVEDGEAVWRALRCRWERGGRGCVARSLASGSRSRIV